MLRVYFQIFTNILHKHIQYITVHTYIFQRCNDTRIHIEPFGTRLSVWYALQTERVAGLILLCLENKRA